jgi:hypothetical protein
MDAVSWLFVRKSSVSVENEISVKADAGIIGVERSGRNQKDKP